MQQSVERPWRPWGYRRGERGRGPLVEVNFSLLAADVGEATANTPDGGQGKHDLLLAIYVGVEHTKNVLELIGDEQGLQGRRGGEEGMGSCFNEERG